MKKVKATTTAIFLGLLFISSGIHAQFKYPSKSQVSAVKGKILLVSYVLEDRTTVDNLRATPDKLAEYRNSIGYLDTLIKRSVQKVWKFSKGVEFASFEEATKIMNDGNSKYAFVNFGIAERKSHEWFYTQAYDSGIYHPSLRSLGKENGYAMVSISLPGKDKKPELVYNCAMPAAYPSQGDITAALELMQNEFMVIMKKPEFKFDDFEAEVKENKKLLKDKTLLIDQDQLEKGVTEAEISKFYPYTVQIAGFDTIEVVKSNCAAGYAYILTIPYKISTVNMSSGSTTPIASYFQIIVNASDGKILGRCVPSKTDVPERAEKIGKHQIKAYTEE